MTFCSFFIYYKMNCNNTTAYSTNNFLSNDIQKLHYEAENHLTNSKSNNTKRLPETVAYFITHLGKTLKASTIKRKLTTISQRHQTAGFTNPTSTSIVQGVWDGLQVKEEGKEYYG